MGFLLSGIHEHVLFKYTLYFFSHHMATGKIDQQPLAVCSHMLGLGEQHNTTQQSSFAGV